MELGIDPASCYLPVPLMSPHKPSHVALTHAGLKNNVALNSADFSPLGRVDCVLFSASVFLFVYFSVNGFLLFPC